MSLTQEQQAKAQEYVMRWTEIGLCTDLADRPAAEAAISLVYECGGLKPPQRVIWCESPAAMLRVAGAEVLTQDQVAAALGASQSGAKPAPLADCIYGQHDAGWLAFYDFMRNELGLVEQTEKLRGLTALAKVCGWACPYENVAYLSERHNVLKRDAQGRLHCITGPALSYPDSWSIYAVRGTHVPAEWVEKRDTLDPRLALTEPNQERRAAIATIIGWHKVMQHLSPKVIDRREMSIERALESARNGGYDYGELIEVELPDEGRARFLSVVCPAHLESDGGQRFLRVPLTVQTAKEANAWTYGTDVTEFAPEARS